MNEQTAELILPKTPLAEAIAFGATIAEASHAIAGADGERPYVVLPEGYQVHDLEHLLPTPTRKRGKITLAQTSAFIEYYKKHRLGSQIYGTTEPPRFVAVLDDHRQIDAGWRDHTAHYNCPLSTEWNTWNGMNRKQMKQNDFAQFIEDNLPDIVEPEAAHMLEVSRTLEAKKNVNFASGVRLANGEVQFTYEEKIEGTAGKGQFRVPETFAIGIPVFHGGPRYRIEARLRYRIADGGQMQMWYDLVRPHKIIEDAALEVWAEIETQTGERILHGSPGL